MKKGITLVLSVVGIILFLVFQLQAQKNVVMAVPVVKEEVYESIKEGRTPVQNLTRAELQIGAVTAAWEETEQRYYIPQNMDESGFRGELGGLLDGQPVSLVWKPDSAFDSTDDAVKDGHLFSCMVYSDTEYAELTVLFTGMPVMKIDGDMGAEGTQISLFDPIFGADGEYRSLQSSAYYNIRGNASKRFEKIGYKLELLENDGTTKRKETLLGMRKDDSWQLKALYSDRSKLRDKLSTELWNNIADLTQTKADTGCRMEYLELIVNGEYRGLYTLVEPTDYKSLGLDKTKDIIYKVGSDERPNDDLFVESEASQSFECGGVHIRQASKTWESGLWTPFQTFWDNAYELDTTGSLETLYSCIDRQNFIDFDLYYNVIAGMDNRFKNIIYSTVMNKDGTYVIRRIPWDQNYSWGDDFEQGEDKDIKNIRFNPELKTKWLNEDVFRNMQALDDTLPADMLRTWKRWRESFLTEERWKAYAREQMAYITDSGAFARDTEKWPDSENVNSTKEIESYIDARFSWLDKYLADLAEQ